MITVRPEHNYDCIYIELADSTSRVQIHLHAQAGSRGSVRKELRQIEVKSLADTVFAVDNVGNNKLPCDPHGLGGSNVYSGHDYEHREARESHDDWQGEEEAADVDAVGD